MATQNEIAKGAAEGPVLLIAGPTASGKSGLALAVAQHFGGTVINADSMQVYRELRVLTARPSEAEMSLVPHRLYGELSGAAPCSAGSWRSLALEAIAEAQAAGRLPIVTGGTGLYLKALQEGLAPVPPVPPSVRDAVSARFDAIGGAAFHAELAASDPRMAARLRVKDRQRLIRAREVLQATGRSLADWQQAQPEAPKDPMSAARFWSIVLMPPRTELYAACDRRFLAMIDAGALEEVRALMALGLSPHLPVMKSLGAPELLRHLEGGLDLSEAVTQAQTKTRRYAKRQMTWLRNQVLGNDSNVNLFETKFSERFLPEIFNIIRQKLLTGDT